MLEQSVGDAAEDGRCCVGCPAADAWVRPVQLHQDDELRVVRRRESDKADNGFVLYVAFFGSDFGGAAFACNAITGYLGHLIARLDDMHHQLTHSRCRFRSDNLVDHRRLGIHGIVTGHPALHDIRAQQLAAVGDGGHCADHLDGRNGDTLPKAVRAQVGHGPAWVIEAPVLAGHLSA